MKCKNYKYKVLKPFSTFDIDKIEYFDEFKKKMTYKYEMSDTYTKRYNSWGNKQDFEDNKAIPIRCGKCLYCKNLRKLAWQARLEMQAKETRKNKGTIYFITLTYNNDKLNEYHLNSNNYANEVQKWFKRLRKNNKDLKIKYFFVHELGSKNYRLHHHGIIFSNYDFLKLEDFSKKINGNMYYTSSNINWNNGYHSINVVKDDYNKMISYVLKYLLKNPLGYIFSRGLGKEQIDNLKSDKGDIYIKDGFILKVPNYKNYLTNDEKIKKAKENFYKFSNQKLKEDVRLNKDFEEKGFEDDN